MNAWFVPSFAVFCFSHKNKSELTKWLTGAGARVNLGFGGMPPFPAVLLPFWQNLTLSLCRFGFLIYQASITISRCGEECTVWILACVAVWKLKSGRNSIMPSCVCALSLPRASFISCPALSSPCALFPLCPWRTQLFSTPGSCRHSKTPLCPAKAVLLSSEASNSFINCLFLTTRLPSPFWKLH